MDASVGDRIVVAATHVAGKVRDGVVVRTAPGGVPPYGVRWSDGHESVVFPGPGVRVEHVPARPVALDGLNPPSETDPQR